MNNSVCSDFLEFLQKNFSLPLSYVHKGKTSILKVAHLA